MSSKIYYYYLHTNGGLIGKPPTVVDFDPEYFDSPFVKKYWKIDLGDRLGAWTFLLEAAFYGAKIERVKELAEKWGCNLEDSIEFIKRFKLPLLEITQALREGMRIFIKEIFKMTEDDYWAKVKKDWRK